MKTINAQARKTTSTASTARQGSRNTASTAQGRNAQSNAGNADAADDAELEQATGAATPAANRSNRPASQSRNAGRSTAQSARSNERSSRQSTRSTSNQSARGTGRNAARNASQDNTPADDVVTSGNASADAILELLDGAYSPGDISAAVKRGGKRSGIAMVGNDNYSATVSLDGEDYRIVQHGDAGADAFAEYMKRKRSVLLPLMELVAQNDQVSIYRTEQLGDLEETVGPEEAESFINWAHRYVESRYSGENAWRSRDHQPPEIAGIVNYGNLRGLLNKMIAFASDRNLNFDIENCFKVRNNEQLVVVDPFM